jgi:uncharacterized membrane protein
MIETGAIRPDDWNIALFVHVLGAFVLVGTLVTAAAFLRTARRDGTLESVRLSFRTLLIAALPAYLVMRVGAQWVASEEGIEEADVTWLDIGYIISDLGALLLIGSIVAAGLAVRGARKAEGTAGGGRGLAWATGLTTVLILAYLVAIWVMATKPA